MSYILIDGKRYYRDDQCGQVILDDVSQAVADRRDQQYRGVYTPPPQPPRAPVAPPEQPARRSASGRHLPGLFHGLIRTATIAVTVCSLLLIGAYCMKEPIRLQTSFHFELREPDGIAARLEQIGDRLIELIENERME